MYSAIVNVAVISPADDLPTFGQRYTLTCTVTGADSLSPTSTYQWFKTTPSRTRVGTNSHTLTFDPLDLSDAGHYSCQVTVFSSFLLRDVTVVSDDYNLRFPSKCI